MDRVNIFAAHDDKRVVGWFDHDKATWWDDRDYNNNGSRGTGRGAGVVRTGGGKWLGLLWTIWQGEERTHVYITDDEARDWLLANNEDEGVEKYFGPLAEEEDRRPGRPEIGNPVQVRLGDLIGPVDDFRDRLGVKRAAAARRLVELGLKVTTPPQGMKAITITCNVASGRIEIDTEGWAGGDARWDFIGSFGDGALHDATEVEPWGDDEYGMDRATQAVQGLGYTIGSWADGPDMVKVAAITGRA